MTVSTSELWFSSSFSATCIKYNGSTWLPVNKLSKEGVSTNSETCCSLWTSAISSSNASKSFKLSTTFLSMLVQYWISNWRHELHEQMWSLKSVGFCYSNTMRCCFMQLGISSDLFSFRFTAVTSSAGILVQQNCEFLFHSSNQ